MKHLIASTAVAASLLVCNAAYAASFNLDFGDSAKPSNAFGAVPGQVGFWNRFDSTLWNLSNVGTGDLSAVIAAFTTVTVPGGANGQNLIGGGDDRRLVEDGFYVGSGSWTVSMTGLTNGYYDIYLYDNDNENVGTGAGTVNGIPFSAINGNYGSGPFVLSSNYHLLADVLVNSGALTITSTSLGPTGLAGLAGLQVVESEAPAAVPEPSTLLLMGAGLCGAAYLRRRKKTATA
jgi:hypothetical protein